MTSVLIAVLVLFNFLSIMYYFLGFIELTQYNRERDGNFFLFLYNTILTNSTINIIFIVTTILLNLIQQ